MYNILANYGYSYNISFYQALQNFKVSLLRNNQSLNYKNNKNCEPPYQQNNKEKERIIASSQRLSKYQLRNAKDQYKLPQSIGGCSNVMFRKMALFVSKQIKLLKGNKFALYKNVNLPASLFPSTRKIFMYNLQQNQNYLTNTKTICNIMKTQKRSYGTEMVDYVNKIQKWNYPSELEDKLNRTRKRCNGNESVNKVNKPQKWGYGSKLVDKVNRTQKRSYRKETTDKVNNTNKDNKYLPTPIQATANPESITLNVTINIPIEKLTTPKKGLVCYAEAVIDEIPEGINTIHLTKTVDTNKPNTLQLSSLEISKKDEIKNIVVDEQDNDKKATKNTDKVEGYKQIRINNLKKYMKHFLNSSESEAMKASEKEIERQKNEIVSSYRNKNERLKKKQLEENYMIPKYVDSNLDDNRQFEKINKNVSKTVFAEPNSNVINAEVKENISMVSIYNTSSKKNIKKNKTKEPVLNMIIKETEKVKNLIQLKQPSKVINIKSPNENLPKTSSLQPQQQPCPFTGKRKKNIYTNMDNDISNKSAQFCKILIDLIKLFSASAVEDMERKSKEGINQFHNFSYRTVKTNQKQYNKMFKNCIGLALTEKKIKELYKVPFKMTKRTSQKYSYCGPQTGKGAEPLNKNMKKPKSVNDFRYTFKLGRKFTKKLMVPNKNTEKKSSINNKQVPNKDDTNDNGFQQYSVAKNVISHKILQSYNDFLNTQTLVYETTKKEKDKTIENVDKSFEDVNKMIKPIQLLTDSFIKRCTVEKRTTDEEESEELSLEDIDLKGITNIVMDNNDNNDNNDDRYAEGKKIFEVISTKNNSDEGLKELRNRETIDGEVIRDLLLEKEIQSDVTANVKKYSKIINKKNAELLIDELTKQYESTEQYKSINTVNDQINKENDNKLEKKVYKMNLSNKLSEHIDKPIKENIDSRNVELVEDPKEKNALSKGINKLIDEKLKGVKLTESLYNAKEMDSPDNLNNEQNYSTSDHTELLEKPEENDFKKINASNLCKIPEDFIANFEDIIQPDSDNRKLLGMGNMNFSDYRQDIHRYYGKRMENEDTSTIKKLYEKVMTKNDKNDEVNLNVDDDLKQSSVQNLTKVVRVMKVVNTDDNNLNDVSQRDVLNSSKDTIKKIGNDMDPFHLTIKNNKKNNLNNKSKDN